MPTITASRQQQRQQEQLRQRDALLAQAGISPERRMRLLDKAFQRLEEQMDAHKYVPTKDGLEEVIDNQARLRAIETTLDFEGVALGKHNEQQGDRSVQVVINAPWFATGHTIGSGEGQVVEVETPKPLIIQEGK